MSTCTRHALPCIAHAGVKPVAVLSHRCIFDKEHVPTCQLFFNAISRSSGTSQIRRIPENGTVEFVSCTVLMDTGTVNSTTCFEVGLLLHATIPEAADSRHTRPWLSCYVSASIWLLAYSMLSRRKSKPTNGASI